ncbi:RDD family protein [Kribbella sp. DT2]|uniref:RDD family protein n=1 Tax=Kribbella sp. DT2 TaxID=3393427 RepID=UPI003CF1CE33
MTALTAATTRVTPRRCAQWALDLFAVLVVSTLITVGSLFLLVKAGAHGRGLGNVLGGVFLGSAFVLQVVNEILLPRRNGGRTVGMLAFGLRTLTLEGTLPSWKQFLVRYLLWVVDGLFWGLVALVVVCCTRYRQRVGDLAARTVVVRSTVSVDEPVLPGPDGELGAVAQPELPLGAGQVRLDGRE